MSWFNKVENYPCDSCSDEEICKKRPPAKCVIYKGPALTYIDLGTNINIELIISTIVNSMAAAKSEQEETNVNILNALNDINTRINAITGVAHPPYVI